MRRKHFLLVGMATYLMVGCSGQVSETRSNPDTSPTSAMSPVATPTDSGTVKQGAVKSGTFVSGEHPTQGTVQIATKNGKSFLELGNAFKTSEMGPDLVVILHRSSDVIGSTKPPAYALKEGDYVVLAPLQKFSGAQSYPISDSVNLAEYKSAAIWCRKFNATFGAAILK